mmetsp:Transcript_8725/g.32494  ORF Transcript_8725/g.32494 Transcript_8725/m.32494 type:complete len:257 (+) Transcript_8725:1624-2394(+)
MISTGSTVTSLILVTFCASLTASVVSKAMPIRRKRASRFSDSFPCLYASFCCSNQAPRPALERSSDGLICPLPSWNSTSSSNDDSHSAFALRRSTGTYVSLSKPATSSKYACSWERSPSMRRSRCSKTHGLRLSTGRSYRGRPVYAFKRIGPRAPPPLAFERTTYSINFEFHVLAPGITERICGTSRTIFATSSTLAPASIIALVHNPTFCCARRKRRLSTSARPIFVTRHAAAALSIAMASSSEIPNVSTKIASP